MTPERITTSGPLDASRLRLGIAQSQYHGWATEKLLAGALDRWARLGGRDEAIIIAPAAGAWELTAVSLALAERADLDGVVALGAVIRGETPHFDFICNGVAQGLTAITLQTGKPVGFGVITCDTREQAEARAGGAVGNKGAEAIEAAVSAALTIRAIDNRDRTNREGLR